MYEIKKLIIINTKCKIEFYVSRFKNEVGGNVNDQTVKLGRQLINKISDKIKKI